VRDEITDAVIIWWLISNSLPRCSDNNFLQSTTGLAMHETGWSRLVQCPDGVVKAFVATQPER
jgi:hypothetical protein